MAPEPSLFVLRTSSVSLFLITHPSSCPLADPTSPGLLQLFVLSFRYADPRFYFSHSWARFIDACVNNALFGRPRFALISRREEGAMRAIVTDEQRRNRPKVGLPEGPGRFRSGDCVVRRSHSPRYAPSSRLVGAPKSPRPNRVLFTQASIRDLYAQTHRYLSNGF